MRPNAHGTRPPAYRFQLLGPVEAWISGAPVNLGGRQRQFLLALLLTRPGAVWPRDALVEALWGDAAVDRGPELLRSLVSRLRGILGSHQDPTTAPGSAEPPVIDTKAGGYVALVDPDSIDAVRFETLVSAAEKMQADRRLDKAIAAFDEALALWRGPAFGDLAAEPHLQAEAVRLEERRLSAVESRLNAMLDRGEHARVATELERLVIEHPYRERLWDLRIQALYRSGRQADALRAYESVRTRLLEDLGVTPGPALQETERRILNHDPSLLGPATPDPVPTAVVTAPAFAVRIDESIPFVGRDEAVAALVEALEKSDLDGRQIALIGGEPGIGKTRLVGEFARRVEHDGGLVLVGQAIDDAQHPYQPFVEILRDFVSVIRPPDLGLALGRRPEELVRLYPELQQLIPGLAAPTRSEPETERYQLFEAVAEWISAASRTRPLALVLDDLHWASLPTVSLVRHLTRSPLTSHILLIATYRHPDIAANPAASELIGHLRMAPETLQIPLDGLDDTAIEHLLEQVPDVTPDESVVRRLKDETAGNPFMIGELVRDLQATGELRRPEGVRDMVEARLRALPPTAVKLLRTAAVIGNEFVLAIVARAAGVDDDEAVSALEACSEQRLVVEDPTEPDRYLFRHTLVRSTILDALSGSRRIRLHARVASALEETGQASAATLARHFVAGRPVADPDRVVEYCLQAATDAAAAYANDAAVDFCNEGLKSIGRDDVRRIDVLTVKGRALRARGDGQYRDVLREAIAAARAIGDGDRLASAVLAARREFGSGGGSPDDEQVDALQAALALTPDSQPQTRVQLLATLAAELGYSPGNHDLQRALSDESVEVARSHGDPRTLVEALVYRRLSVWDPDLSSRLTDTEELSRLADTMEDPLLRWQAHSACIVPYIEAGALSTAVKHLEAVRAIGEQFADPRPRWSALYHGALVAQVRGELDEAERLATEASEVGHPAGEVDSLLAYAGQHFALQYERGELDACMEMIELGAEYGGESARAPMLGAAAMLSAELGRPDDARFFLHQFLDQHLGGMTLGPVWIMTLCMHAAAAAHLRDGAAADTLSRLLLPHRGGMAVASAFTLGAVDRYLGLLAAATGRHDEARQHFRAALSLHTRVEARGFAARTRLDWAESMVGSGGDQGEAVALARDARATASSLGLARVETRAGELLERLDGSESGQVRGRSPRA